MTSVTEAPYGSWASPIAAVDLAATTHPVGRGAFAGSEIWWAEGRGDEGGRTAIRRAGPDGGPEDVLPALWNARSRVHEYGGGAWAPARDGALVFVEFGDQRLYALDPGGEPRPLTPPGRGFRFGDVSVDGDRILTVREHHDERGIRRDLVSVPLDGSAAEDDGRILSIVSGSRFLAYPRLSPDGRRLAWIAWDHPRMPWDGTELRVGELDGGRVTGWRTLLGSPAESVLQPEWDGPDRLTVLSDRSGWWNPYRVHLDGGLEPLLDVPREIGGPLWSLGTRWYQPLDDGRLALASTSGTSRLDILDPHTGVLETLDLPFTAIEPCASSGPRLLVRCGGPAIPSGLRLVDLPDGGSTATVTDVRTDLDDVPDAAYLPVGEPATFPGPRGEVHALVYPPRNPRYRGPDGERPPYIAMVHGGPTGQARTDLDLVYAYFTSRGLGVIDVDYGGSTGYGRAYRERLRGQWGVVDVEDTVAAVTALADAGRADPSRLAIEGGSAGGWTVLAALTGTTVFAAGVSYYGVAELTEFAQETHDFESRYLDGLVGPLPESAELYAERAPLNHVDQLSVPVLLLQGADDPIVPPAQAERFRSALAAAGLPHACILYEGESHGFRRAETIIHAREAELSFYGQVFGFEPPGIPTLRLERGEG